MRSGKLLGEIGRVKAAFTTKGEKECAHAIVQGAHEKSRAIEMMNTRFLLVKSCALRKAAAACRTVPQLAWTTPAAARSAESARAFGAESVLILTLVVWIVYQVVVLDGLLIVDFVSNV